VRRLQVGGGGAGPGPPRPGPAVAVPCAARCSRPPTAATARFLHGQPLQCSCHACAPPAEARHRLTAPRTRGARPRAPPCAPRLAQALAARYAVRVTFLSGDVHVGAFGCLQAHPKVTDRVLDPHFMLQVGSPMFTPRSSRSNGCALGPGPCSAVARGPGDAGRRPSAHPRPLGPSSPQVVSSAIGNEPPPRGVIVVGGQWAGGGLRDGEGQELEHGLLARGRAAPASSTPSTRGAQPLATHRAQSTPPP
jgi:hypothetical protein